MIYLVQLVPTPTPTPGPTAAEFGPGAAICLIVLVALVGMSAYAGIKEKERFSKAGERIRGMSDEELGNLEIKILGYLNRVHGPDSTVANVAEFLEVEFEVVCLRSQRLVKMNLIEVIQKAEGAKAASADGQDPQGSVQPLRLSRATPIQLTAEGYKRVQEAVSNGRFSVTGDYIRAEAGAIVTTRSIVVNSYNRLAEKHDTGLADAIAEVGKAVDESGNDEAKELFGELVVGLGADEKKPGVLRRLFVGVQETAPTVAALTDAVAKISSVIG